MKKISLILAIVMILSVCLSACNNQASTKNSDPVVTLSEETCSLAIGETYQLSYTVVPENTAVEYIVSDANVISVDASGKITALAAGNASVAVSAGEYSRDYLEVTVKVPAASGMPVITLSSDSLEIISGMDFTVSAQLQVGCSVINDTSITWNTADPAIATVENGTVSAVAVGTTEIVASAEYGGQKIETVFPVTVIEYYEITLDQDLIEVPMGTTIRVNATIRNADGQIVEPQEGELEYISSDPSAIVVDGTLFKVISVSDRIPSVGVRYKGNVATVPVDIFSVSAKFFQTSASDFYGEVSGQTVSGIVLKHNGYQPHFYFSEYGRQQIAEYAQKNGFSVLRMHSYPIFKNNSWRINGRYLPTNQWSTTDVPVSEIDETFWFWSESDGPTEVYMWFEFR